MFLQTNETKGFLLFVGPALKGLTVLSGDKYLKLKGLII